MQRLIERESVREKKRSIIRCIARHDTLPLLGNTRGNRDAGKFTRYICQEDKENKTLKNRKNLGQEKFVCVCVLREDNVRFEQAK